MTSFLAALLEAVILFAGPGPMLERGPAVIREVRFEKEIRCASPLGRGFLQDVEVRIAVPKDDLRQRILSLDFFEPPSRFVDDGYGNRLAVFNRRHMGPGVVWRVGWTAQVQTHEVTHRVTPAQIGHLTDIPPEITAAYLGDQDRYGMGDPLVQALARQVGDGARDALDLAFRINELLRERLTYRNDGRWDTVPRVLENGHGSCSEYNFAFIALARLNGLPARYVGASSLDPGDDAVFEDRIHHRWTEVWLPGYGWFPVDASRNDGEKGDPTNSWFGRTSALLLVLMKGDGGPGHPLRWGYVAALDAHEGGDARAVSSKRFLWSRSDP
jgi:transglutaminase-like putative cysteine protease